ncbi:hypothetical protein PQO03_01065 [Lentisphaera profundi]|uniref:Uncharacterized protein n=1 Tax=Lentisphaera profundi TaxID=1658616 RepID=A0ABY7VRP9_9BACT|nr:hypothetical protein [Lentisphaera profundi]WDE96556.1 hypothetical protein PQO03_01065 [Lentisphaera profundi]
MEEQSDAKLFKIYASDLIRIHQFIKNGSEILDKELIELLLKRQAFWSSARTISIFKNEVIVEKKNNSIICVSSEFPG